MDEDLAMWVIVLLRVVPGEVDVGLRGGEGHWIASYTGLLFPSVLLFLHFLSILKRQWSYIIHVEFLSIAAL